MNDETPGGVLVQVYNQLRLQIRMNEWMNETPGGGLVRVHK